MRESLTIVAIALIMALTAALIGPYFYDWNQARALIETRLSRAVGSPISIGGSIDVKLLPTPYLIATDIRNHPAQPGDVLFSAKAMRFELAAMPLLGGELNFTEAHFESPHLTLYRDGTALHWPSLPQSTPSTVRFERLSFTDGTLVVTDQATGTSQTLTGIEALASAASLDGPFKAEGTLALANERAGFKLSTATRDAQGLRTKLQIEGHHAFGALRLDGTIPRSTTASLTMQALYDDILPSTAGDIAIQAAGPITLTSQGLTSDALEVKLGPAEHPFKLSGSAAWGFDRPALSLALAGGTFDLDLALTNAGQPATPLALAHSVQGLLLDMQNRIGKLPLHLDLRADSLVIGGESLADPHIGLDDNGQFVPTLLVEAHGPFASQMRLNGTLFGSDNFVGALDFSTRDAPRLLHWISPETTGFPAQNVTLHGPISWNNGFYAKDTDLTLERTRLHGEIGIKPGMANDRLLVTARLTSDALDLDTIPDLTTLKSGLGNADFDWTLDARTVKLARVGQGALDIGHITLDLARKADSLTLNKVQLDNIGGASLVASGHATDAGLALSAHADAQKLDELARVLARLFPGPLTQTLQRRAPLLAPLHLETTLESTANDLANVSAWRQFAVSGTLAGTQIQLQHSFGNDGRSLNAQLHSDDIAHAFAQFGIASLPLPLGKAEANLTLRGAPGSAAAYTLSAALAGTDLAANGQLAADFSEAAGPFTLKGPDSVPLLQALSLLLPDIQTRLPVALNGTARWTPAHLTLSDLTGSAAGTGLTGTLTIDTARPPPGEPLAVSGALTLDKLDLPILLSPVLGMPQSPRPGQIWPETAFATGMAQLPALTLDITAKEMALWPQIIAKPAAFHLALNNDDLRLTGFRLALMQGQLAGDMALHRSGPLVAMTMQATLDKLAFASTAASGRLNGTIALAGSGANWLQLVKSLGGSGTIRPFESQIARLAPTALSRTVTAAEQDDIATDAPALSASLLHELAKAPRRLAEDQSPLTLANGLLTLGPLGLQRDGAANQPENLTAALDLTNGMLRASLPLAMRERPKGWTGETPTATVLWQGPWLNPVQSVNVDLLTNVLASRAIERSQAKIEALDADIRERAMMLRRSKALQFLDQRQKEEETFRRQQAEEQRKKDEESRKKEEESRKKEEETRRKQDEQRKPSEIITLPAPTSLPLSKPEPPIPPEQAPLQLVPNSAE